LSNFTWQPWTSRHRPSSSATGPNSRELAKLTRQVGEASGTTIDIPDGTYYRQIGKQFFSDALYARSELNTTVLKVASHRQLRERSRRTSLSFKNVVSRCASVPWRAAVGKDGYTSSGRGNFQGVKPAQKTAAFRRVAPQAFVVALALNAANHH
jgi:predicted metalloendopeptidase